MSLQKVLGIGGYRTAWLLLQKIRLAMVKTSDTLLSGQVEVDECFIGGVAEGGKRGRGAEKKVLVAVATEANGRIRMKVVENTKYKTLLDFVDTHIEKGSHITTDGWGAYRLLPSRGYKHLAVESKSKALGNVHLTISLVKRWMLGTLQGNVSVEHMQRYLDEFTFRYNRRKSKSRGLLFHRVIENSIQLEATRYCDIIMPKAS
jgi:transposase-like protein